MIRPMAELEAAIDMIVRRCLAVADGEQVLVVADSGTRAIGEALREGAAGAGADAVLAVMDPRENDGTEPPPTIAAALAACDVYIAPTTRSLSHTPARKAATEAGARGATMPGVNEDMLARAMAIDFDLMAARSKSVAALMDAGTTARVTCPRGSDLTLDLTGRAGIADDGDITKPGSFGNLPCGEGFIAPLGGEGTVLASSLGPMGVSDEPVTLTIRGGRLTDVSGSFGPEWFTRLTAQGEPGTNLAELGVGTNDRARLTGNVLEDEKILGTIHVAFGASAAIGGTVSVPIHLDVVVLDASLEIDGRQVLDAGRWVLESGSSVPAA
jgi:leucyl aminopeptidase (aminopeptidase T)